MTKAAALDRIGRSTRFACIRARVRPPVHFRKLREGNVKIRAKSVKTCQIPFGCGT